MVERRFLQWIAFWRNLRVLRLTGFIECLYGLAILWRPDTGSVGMIAHDVGFSGIWFGVLFLVGGVPLLIVRLPVASWFLFSIPIHLYTLAAILWVLRGEDQPATAIAANIAVLLLLYQLGARIQWGNHDE
jgi:hypothetical protein